jgi:hypothetical protein
MVLRLNQETHAPRLHMHGVDRTWRHPTSRSLGHRVPDLCNHPRSSAPGLILLPQSSSLHTMLHLPPTHQETSNHDSPNETKIKDKQNETIPNSNSNLTKSMTHHNQTKERTTWFLISQHRPGPCNLSFSRCRGPKTWFSRVPGDVGTAETRFHDFSQRWPGFHDFSQLRPGTT